MSALANANQIKNITHKPMPATKRYSKNAITSNPSGTLKLTLASFVQIQRRSGTQLNKNAKPALKNIQYSTTLPSNAPRRYVLQNKSGIQKN